MGCSFRLARGALCTVTNVESANAMDAAALLDGQRGSGRGGVWSWHPWAGAKSAGHLAGDGDYEVTDIGESTHNAVKTIAQGMSMFRLHLWLLTRVLSLLHTRLRAQRNTRHSLRPLLSEDVGSCKNSDMSCRGNAESRFDPV
jgi:hypothetical protein